VAEHDLYIVTVTDLLIPALVGQAGCHYDSPAQDEQQARTLIRVLLGVRRAPVGAGPWQADGRRTTPHHSEPSPPVTTRHAHARVHRRTRYGQRTMSGRKLIPITITLDGAPERSETRLASAGAYALVLSSVLPDRAIELQSSYLGHPGTPTQASHLVLAPGIRDSDAVEHDESSIPVMIARRRCIYDHLQRLQDLLAELGHTAQIPLADDALLTVEL
jgi:hypothetical protein